MPALGGLIARPRARVRDVEKCIVDWAASARGQGSAFTLRACGERERECCGCSRRDGETRIALFGSRANRRARCSTFLIR